MNTLLLYTIGGVLLGTLAGYFGRKFLASKKGRELERQVQKRLEEAESKAKDIVLGAKDKAASILGELKEEEKARRSKLDALEDRLADREKVLDKKLNSLTEDEKALRSRETTITEREEEIDEVRARAEKALEEASGLSSEKAKEALIAQIKERHEKDLAQTLQALDRERKEKVEKRAQEIVTTALERYAREHTSELTTTNFPLEDSDLKGKIIGREGRNIRALERATGVEFVIDETPDSIVISSFDPYRREVARIALERLLKDGRMQPAKIEEEVENAKNQVNKRMVELGEDAAAEVGIYDLPDEIIKLVGRLHFRTSYGQNVLTHSIEVAHLAGMIAGELGIDVGIAKRGGLLHDIGKAIDHEVEGTHVELGMKLLSKYNVDENIILAMRSHHEDYPYAIPEAYVVTTADAISGARPGARRGSMEDYLKRLTDLENVAKDFDGVKDAYAISAGRELRVFVLPEKIDDFRALELAREIANRIQTEMRYPGEIKVNVIRESRAIEYAK